MRFRTEPTRFPNGLTNVNDKKTFRNVPFLDPSLAHTYFNDFDTYVAGDWTVTETQAGATQALTDGDGGQLLLTNSAADNDINQLQKVGESFKWELGKRMWGKCRFKTSDATDTDLAIGLLITDTTIIAGVTDGFYFLKADDAATMVFKAGKNSAYSTSSVMLTLAADTFYTVGFFISGASYVDGGTTYYPIDLFAGTGHDPDFVARLAVDAANMCDDEELTVTFCLQNGAAAAKTATIDYMLFGKER